MDKSEEFRGFIKNKLKFKLFTLKKLPAVLFSGIKVPEISEDKAVVTIKLKYLTKNPFKSIYFASQAMAAELSTGVLAMSYVFKRKPKVSMLVFNMRADFHKKAVGKIQFTCNDGLKLKEAVEKTIETSEGVIVETKSTGVDKEGDVVSEFYFTWTFKAKK